MACVRMLQIAALAAMALPVAAQAQNAVVIDLDNSGLSVIDESVSLASFDWQAQGTPARTPWIGKGEGFLVYDENANGMVDGLSELFSNTRASNGFADLAKTADSNGDGMIDSKDTAWPLLKVWTDVDGNGVSDVVELRTVEQAGIGSINTKYIRAYETVGDVQVPWKSGAAMTDGSMRAVYDVDFVPTK